MVEKQGAPVVAIAVGVSVPIVVILALIIVVIILLKRKGSKPNAPVEIEMNREGVVKEKKKEPNNQFLIASTTTQSKKLNESSVVLKITQIPGEEIKLGEKLGSGHFGSVYKGKWGGTEVALKKLDNNQELNAEINILGYDSSFLQLIYLVN